MSVNGSLSLKGSPNFTILVFPRKKRTTYAEAQDLAKGVWTTT